MTPKLYLDFETRSTLNLKEVGLWNYARHPDTDVWCAAYALNDAEPSLWIPGDPPLSFSGVHVVAHNAQFELEIINEIMVGRYGWPRLEAAQIYCTMAQAYAAGLPGGLEDAALAVGLHVHKDSEGRAIMLRMARPRSRPGVTPIVWWDEPERLARLYEYCKQDVRVERELDKRLCPLSAQERRIQLMDWEINRRGVAVDLVTARAGANMAEEIKERAGRELSVITDGAVTSPTALSALKGWLRAKHGIEADSLDKDAVEDYLADPKLPEGARLALIQRQEAGKASVAKLDRILSLAGSDSRLHHALQYHGASTGRWAARGVQVHNLVRNMPPENVVDEILGFVRDGELDWINTAYGPPMEMISQCSRSFFVPADGHVLIGGDFSNVEGRGTAWISGEEWKLKAFRDCDAGTGPDIYRLTASKLLRIPLNQITAELRQVPGKVAELAFGYQGGVGAGRRFAPAGTPDTKLNEWKLGWRADHPKIVATWAELEEAAITAVENPGQAYGAGVAGRGVRFKKAGSFLWCKLPSGRVMCYPYPKLLPGLYGKPQLTYMTVPSENDKGKIIKDVLNANNWARIATYGGALMENVVQAICRDLLAYIMLELHRLDYPIVLHVHDEVVLEIRRELAAEVVKVVEKLLRTPPAWAADFPLWADVKIMERYRK